MVYHVDGGPPRFRHGTESAAITEAERLARQCPGATFVVLEATHARKVDSMRRLDLRPAADHEFREVGEDEPDDIPF